MARTTVKFSVTIQADGGMPAQYMSLPVEVEVPEPPPLNLSNCSDAELLLELGRRLEGIPF